MKYDEETARTLTTIYQLSTGLKKVIIREMSKLCIEPEDQELTSVFRESMGLRVTSSFEISERSKDLKELYENTAED